MEHAEILPECAGKFAHLEGVAESYAIHKEESKTVRDVQVTHTEQLRNFSTLASKLDTLILTIVIAIIGIAVTWGMLLNRVDNLEKYSKFIMEHSYGVQDYLKK